MRMYEMFMGPFDQGKSWDPHGILGINRFLNRVWNFALENKKTKSSNEKAVRALHRAIKKVTGDIEHFQFNTAISALMICLNDIEKELLMPEEIVKFLKLCFPFAPHISQELAQQLGFKKLLDYESWPKWDEAMLVEDRITLAIQVNGKLRDTIEVSANIGEDEAKKLALASEKVKTSMQGKEPKKVIYVPRKIVNIVTGFD